MSVINAAQLPTFDEMLRDLLLAMVAAQNEASTSFIEGIIELAGKDIEVKYTKDGTEKKVTGNALAFGILPTLLQIQQGVIEIRTALTIEEKGKSGNPVSKADVGVKSKMGYKILSAPVDAKYSNTYSYKLEASSIIRVQVAPTPLPQPLMQIIEKITR